VAREHLQALVDDVDRLLAAGSAAAVGDERLHQRAAALRELGQQVPALASAADALDRVGQADRRQANRALLDLVVMARQVRIGLGASAPEGDVTPLPPSGPWTTDLPTAELYSLAGALWGRDAGRIDFLESAAARDLRLWPMLVQPLDTRGEMGDHVALRMLPRFGPPVLPDLERDLDLRQHPGAGRRLATIALIDFEAAVQLCLRRFPQESNVLWLMGQLGRPAVELLVHVLTNPHGNYARWDLERIASDIVARFAEDAVPLLRPALTDPDAARRETAIQLLAQLGRSAAAAVPDVQAALRDNTLAVRLAAARALGKMGRAASAAYPALIACLDDPENDMRQTATEALKSLGMPGADVVPALIETLDHPSEAVRLAIVGALSKAAARNKSALAALTAAKKREAAPAVRSAIEWVLKLVRSKR
jgi:HEAT repeat protein